jgi:hypothetical protein
MQVQGGQHVGTSSVVLQGLPLAGGPQQVLQGQQPKPQHPCALQGLAPTIDLIGQSHHFHFVLQAVPGTPVAHAGLTQAVLQAPQDPGVNRHAAFEPVQDCIGTGVPGAGAQQGHQRRAGTRGGQLPTVFVTQAQAGTFQHGTHAARQSPIKRHQGHRPTPGLDVGHDTTGGLLRLVFHVASGEQADPALSRVAMDRRGREAPGKQPRHRARHRLRLKALQQHQAIDPLRGCGGE